MTLISRVLLTSILIGVTISNVVGIVANSNDDSPSEKCDVLLNLTDVGLQRLPNNLVQANSITHLILDDNQISSVSSKAFSSLPKLSYISIANNKLHTLDLEPFSQLENLKTLNLNENCDLVTITNYLSEPVEDSFNYEYRYHRHRYRETTIRSEVSIKYCSFKFESYPPNLTHLFIENNNLNSLVFTSVEFRELTHLYISHNPIKMDEETLSNLSIYAPALTHLYLQNCSISQFNISNLPNITALYLDNNNINSICYDNCEHGSSYLILDGAQDLEVLSLSHNEIFRIYGESFHYLNNLTILDLSHNKILQIRNGTFDKLYMLQSLSLEYNNILYLKDNDMLGSLISLQNLSFSHNNIINMTDVVFENLVSLKILRLDYNKIPYLEIGIFSNLKSLETLSLAGNQLTYILETSLPTPGLLKSLNLDENNFTHLENISISTAPNLISLSLKSNPLTSIPARWFTAMSQNLTIVL